MSEASLDLGFKLQPGKVWRCKTCKKYYSKRPKGRCCKKMSKLECDCGCSTTKGCDCKEYLWTWIKIPSKDNKETYDVCGSTSLYHNFNTVKESQIWFKDIGTCIEIGLENHCLSEYGYTNYLVVRERTLKSTRTTLGSNDSNYDKRLRSFKYWPVSLVQTKEALAQNVFSYTNIGDIVQCDFCHIKLKKLAPFRFRM